MTPLDLIEQHPVTIGATTACLPLLIPKVRALLGRLYHRLFKGSKMQAQILAEVCAIRHELQFNGGNSLKDMVAIQVNRQRAQFWHSEKPSLEMDTDVQVMLVSETLCRLCDVSNPELLKSRNWLNFLDGRVDEFLIAFNNAAKFRSSLSFRLKLRADDGRDRGEWELRISPITEINCQRQIYSGYFRPVCGVAKAAELGV